MHGLIHNFTQVYAPRIQDIPVTAYLAANVTDQVLKTLNATLTDATEPLSSVNLFVSQFGDLLSILDSLTNSEAVFTRFAQEARSVSGLAQDLVGSRDISGGLDSYLSRRRGVAINPMTMDAQDVLSVFSSDTNSGLIETLNMLLALEGGIQSYRSRAIEFYDSRFSAAADFQKVQSVNDMPDDMAYLVAATDSLAAKLTSIDEENLDSVFILINTVNDMSKLASDFPADMRQGIAAGGFRHSLGNATSGIVSTLNNVDNATADSYKKLAPIITDLHEQVKTVGRLMGRLVDLEKVLMRGVQFTQRGLLLEFQGQTNTRSFIALAEDALQPLVDFGSQMFSEINNTVGTSTVDTLQSLDEVKALTEGIVKQQTDTRHLAEKWLPIFQRLHSKLTELTSDVRGHLKVVDTLEGVATQVDKVPFLSAVGDAIQSVVDFGNDARETLDRIDEIFETAKGSLRVRKEARQFNRTLHFLQEHRPSPPMIYEDLEQIRSASGLGPYIQAAKSAQGAPARIRAMMDHMYDAAHNVIAPTLRPLARDVKVVEA
jgi:hypothetical protein